MKLSILRPDLFIKANDLKEVTNPVVLSRGNIPTPDGLLSTEIFGSTPVERKQFAYIDLHGYFFQPIVYKILEKLDRRIEYAVAGTKNFSIDKDGNMVEDPEGGTGLDWLYKNWSKFNFKRNESKIRDMRIDVFMNHSRDELFTRYLIVEPAYYRDINLQSATGRPSLHEINTGSTQTNGSSYSGVLRLATVLKNSGDYQFAQNNTKYRLQMQIVDIYEYFKSKIEKKRGIIRKGLLGKNVDYGSRLVISSPHYNVNKYTDTIIDFTHAGLPLADCISNFTPFMIGWVSNYFRSEFESTGNKFPVYNKDNPTQVNYYKITNASDMFSDSYIKKLMNTFIHSFSERFMPITVKTEVGEKQLAFMGKSVLKPNQVAKDWVYRPFTITDLFYLAASDIAKRTHIIITRYPISTFQSLYPIRYRALSTQNTCELTINNTLYKYYPVIDMKASSSEVASSFIDVLQMQNTYLKTLGADYDGDQISVRGVFTQEANAECERILKSKANVLSIKGSNIRTTSNEAIQTLFMLTKDK